MSFAASAIPKRRGPARTFRNIAIIIGVLGIVLGSPIGQVIYVVSLLSVIGIPIAMIVFAVPTISMVVVSAFIIWRFSKLRTMRAGVVVSFVCVAVLMAYIPIAHNAEIRSRVSQLTSGDIGRVEGKIATNFSRDGTVGMATTGRNLCREACVHLLMTGQASKVIVFKLNSAMTTADFKSYSYSYRMEKRDTCERPRGGGGVRVHSKNKRDKTPGTISGDYARRLDQGYCVIIEEAMVGDADIVFVSTDRTKFEQPRTLSPINSLIEASNMAVYERDTSGIWTTRWQKTPMRYSFLKPALAFIFHTGAGLQTTSELWRKRVSVDTKHQKMGELLRRAGFSVPSVLN